MDNEGTRGDLRWGTIPALLAEAVQRRGDAEALVDLSGPQPVRLSFSDLAERVDGVAKGLIAAGIDAGDRVAIWAPNCWEWVVALLGLQSAGAVLVPLNTRYKGVEAADILRRSGARALFTVDGFLGNDYVTMLRNTAPEILDGMQRLVILRSSGSDHSDDHRTEGSVTLEELTASGSAVTDDELARRREAISPEDTSDLLFTSGTTGAPKGVIQTHASSLRAFADWADLVGLRSDDRYLVINPFFHTFGYKAGILAGLITGCTLVPLPTFDVDRAAEVIVAEGISMIPGPPTLYQTLLNHPGFDPDAVDTLRLAVTGAAAVPVALVEAMRDRLGFETVITAYGLTETCGVVTACRPEDDAETISHTSGRAIPGVEVRVVDESGSVVPPGHPGEILVRGYNVMRGYFEDPEQTAEAIDADGWLHTGDVGTMDERGYVDITDRLKDMFIVGGFNAYPAEIEALLCTHPGIAAAAVVGLPDDRMGEVAHAFVVPASGSDLSADDVVSWARENMANYKAPRTVEVVPELPLNASGKVLRYELRERARRA
ncbi:MAG: FadD3 family acyl-CoA ligase [Microthrixaceae bacterium]|nr:FadD3 family acyl-CoA ligase [Microthrixaceae bacterium]MCB1011615.1 FadD3 family acyl-CoA ligase [Microthrixaceae bacterium]MCO5320266.1 FadD3 family acyl-CoA ligase [Microthrixaceae bacterium]